MRLCVPLYRTWNVIAEAKTGKSTSSSDNYSIVAGICCMKCIKSRNYLKHQEATMHQCSHYNSIVLHKKRTAIIIMGITKWHQKQQEQNKYEHIVPIKYMLYY